MILSEWDRRQLLLRRGEPSCSLCGLNWMARDAVQTGFVDLGSSWCSDTTACGERWLRKFLSGRTMTLESVTFLGHGPGYGPRKQSVFEVAYQAPEVPESKKRVVMPEVRPGGDRHRRSEHYHLIEFGKDITDSFAP